MKQIQGLCLADEVFEWAKGMCKYEEMWWWDDGVKEIVDSKKKTSRKLRRDQTRS